MSVVARVERPRLVRVAIAELMDLAAELESRRETLTRIALDMKEFGADTTELADASHDLLHGWKHLTSARRALVMTWPSEEESG